LRYGGYSSWIDNFIEESVYFFFGLEKHLRGYLRQHFDGEVLLNQDFQNFSGVFGRFGGAGCSHIVDQNLNVGVEASESSFNVINGLFGVTDFSFPIGTVGCEIFEGIESVAVAHHDLVSLRKKGGDGGFATVTVQADKMVLVSRSNLEKVNVPVIVGRRS